MSNEMELLKKQIKDKIQIYISKNELDNAMNLVEECLTIDLNDVEIYSMKAVVLIMQGSMREAENVLKQGLLINKLSFDLNYNLGYVCEQRGEFHNAISYYEKAIENCVEDKMRTDITIIIERILSEHKIARKEKKKKIAFFVKQGMDNFINDIITGLSEEYNTRRIIVTEYSQIDEGMQWADICWFEWCDELIMYGSSHRLATEKKIVCRLHRYEVFTDYPQNVNWSNVDKLIIVTAHLKNILISKIHDIDTKVEVITVNNGVDLNKYEMKERKCGFNIAYVGYLHQRKNPSLLLQVISKLVKQDNKYKLYIAGQFQDELVEMYFNYQIKEMGLQNNVIFEGWQNDINKWLENKNYILSCSMHESFGYGIAEAMARGMKPIIHNFIFADEIWDKEYLFDTVDEAVNMIMDRKYDSNRYRKFIQDNYALENQIKRTKNVMQNLEMSMEKEKLGENINIIDNFDYKDYWNNRLNNKFDIEGVGYIGLGKIYNEFLYKSRFEILSYIIDKLFGNINNKSILELGPGIGMFTDYFYQNDVDKYYAIDISKKSQKELSEKFKRFKFKLGDIAQKENYRKDKYDLIFAADVLLHLTDEEKYKNVIKNLSDVLKDDGYIVIFDPITVINSKSISPHAVVRDVRYVEEMLKENDLDVIGFMPSAFFMNYPFDKEIIKEKANTVQKIFDLIQVVFSSTDISDVTKKDLAQWLSLLDKRCIISNKFGLSQKVMIIKKKDNNTLIDFNIGEVWDYNDIEIQLFNNEGLLNENDEIKKYDLVNIFKNYVNGLID